MLNLQNWGVLDTEDGVELIINAIFSIEPRQCIQCKSKQIIKHGPKHTSYRDAPMHGKPSVIHAKLNRYKCKSCKCTFVQPITGMHSEMRMTERCFKYIQAQSLRDTFTNIAHAVGCNEKTVRSIAHEYLHSLSNAYKPRIEGWIGIDETTLDGKLRFIVSDLKRKRPLEMLPDREISTVSNWMWKHRNANIEVFVMDMWRGYKSVVYKVFPNAVIVVDKFHVVRMANEAVDKIRLKLSKDRVKAIGQDWKRRKSLLRMRYNNLSEHGKYNLDMWLENEPEIQIAHNLKELFYLIYEMPTRDDAESLLDEWLEMIPADMCKGKSDFKPLVTIFKEWRKEIMNYFDYPITNGYTEALNGVAKVMNRQGRGYSYEIVRAKLLFKNNVPILPSENGQPSQEVIDEIINRVDRCIKCGAPRMFGIATDFGDYEHCDDCFLEK